MKTPDFKALAKDKFNELWGRSEVGWQHQPVNEETEDPEYWTKTCAFFKAYITHWGNNVFDIALHSSDDVLAFETDKFDSLGIDVVKARAEDIIKEFVMAANRHWLGIDFDVTRPADEIRLKQISAGIDGKVYGLDESGIVYINQGQSWRKMMMDKAAIDIVREKRDTKDARD